MIDLTIKLLNMSFTAASVALIVIFLRLLFKRIPKGYSYALWIVVMFRFLCPFTLESAVSLLPVAPEPMKPQIVYQEQPAIESGVVWIDRPVNQVLGESMPANPSASVNPIQIALYAGGIIWIAGMALLFLYHAVLYVRLRLRLATAVRIDDNLYQSDQIGGPFVMGIIRPRIYLPAGLEEEELKCILIHERIHIKRKDYLVKAAGFLVLLIHWFNPLAWLSVVLMSRDMEMSCDEKALKQLGMEEKKSYSMTLLEMAKRRSGLVMPLAFGETNTKQRVRNVLNYKKPRFWISICAVILIGAAAVTLLTNPQKDGSEAVVIDPGEDQTSADLNVIQPTDEAEAGGSQPDDGDNIAVIGGADGPTSIFLAGKLGGEPVEQDLSWLSGQMIVKDGTGTGVVWDSVSEDSLMFHGDFGLVIFGREGDEWLNMELLTDAGLDKNPEIRNVYEDAAAARRKEAGYMAGLEANIQKALAFYDSHDQPVIYDIWEMEDGDLAILGSFHVSGDTSRLVDLFYGRYDVSEETMHQTYLFGNDTTELVYGKGRSVKQYYLFSADGYDYFMRSLETPLSFEKDMETFGTIFGNRELIRCRDGETEVLDRLAAARHEMEEQVIYTGERIIYYGGEKEEMISFKDPALISINYDGSGRKTYNPQYGVFDALTLEQGVLYYGGWTNANEYPKPIYRMNTDFSGHEKVGSVDGELLAVHDGTFYFLDPVDGTICISRMDKSRGKTVYDKCGFPVETHQIIRSGVQGDTLYVRFLSREDYTTTIDYEVALAADGWWKDKDEKN